ncbi:hypothetical protein M378DRAFT_160073 [Amanita muscaria Koide BX008]|uniref:Uncharacterized protein n=1 Tax=Amanita muscaria (strain Koide BX008) TaxID=946122 RepID=A0A0C2XCI0_AMAMK|nr:hypothetical protein M378DRAFT_160073 [Amanita muscaria Koide BX008]
MVIKYWSNGKSDNVGILDSWPSAAGACVECYGDGMGRGRSDTSPEWAVSCGSSG